MRAVEQEMLTDSGQSSYLWRSPMRLGTSEVITSADVPVIGPERREISFEVSANLAKQNWFRPTLDRLLGFLSLGEDWNGYGERPIHESALKRAVAVLDAVCTDGLSPEVFPTSLGGVQIEWSVGGYEIEIEVPPAGPASILLAEPNGVEREMVADASSVKVWSLLKDHAALMRNATG